jgi:hypothetical protein
MMKCFSLYYEAEAQDGRVDVEVRNSASWLRFLAHGNHARAQRY